MLVSIVGAFILYLIIQSKNVGINPISKKSNNNKVTTMIGRNEIARKFIEKGTASILNYLIKYVQTLYNKKPRYSFLNAYSNLYPLLNYEFEKILPPIYRNDFGEIMTNWPSRLDTYKEYENYFTNLRETQRTCKHEYVLFIQRKDGHLDKVTTTEDDHSSLKKVKSKTDYYVKICSICSHRKRVNMKRDSK